MKRRNRLSSKAAAAMLTGVGIPRLKAGEDVNAVAGDVLPPPDRFAI